MSRPCRVLVMRWCSTCAGDFASAEAAVVAGGVGEDLVGVVAGQLGGAQQPLQRRHRLVGGQRGPLLRGQGAVGGERVEGRCRCARR